MSNEHERDTVFKQLAGVYEPKEGDELISALVICEGCNRKGVKFPGLAFPKGWFVVECFNYSKFLSKLVCSPSCACEAIAKVCGG